MSKILLDYFNKFAYYLKYSKKLQKTKITSISRSPGIYLDIPYGSLAAYWGGTTTLLYFRNECKKMVFVNCLGKRQKFTVKGIWCDTDHVQRPHKKPSPDSCCSCTSGDGGSSRSPGERGTAQVKAPFPSSRLKELYQEGLDWSGEEAVVWRPHRTFQDLRGLQGRWEGTLSGTVAPRQGVQWCVQIERGDFYIRY